MPEGEVKDGKYSNHYFIIFIYYDKKIKNFVIGRSHVGGIWIGTRDNLQR